MLPFWFARFKAEADTATNNKDYRKVIPSIPSH